MSEPQGNPAKVELADSPAVATPSPIAVEAKADAVAPAVTPDNAAGEGVGKVEAKKEDSGVAQKPAVPFVTPRKPINFSELSSCPSSLHSLNPTPHDDDSPHPKLTPFTPNDYLLWFSDSFSFDKPKHFLMMTECFRNVRLQDVGLAEAYDVPSITPITPAGTYDFDSEKSPVTKEDEKSPADGETKPQTEAERAQTLLTKFCLALDAFHDANEDYYDRLDAAHLAWDQKDYEKNVMPRVFAGLEAKKEMMLFWCEVEGKEPPPEQELAEQYKGPLWRGYND